MRAHGGRGAVRPGRPRGVPSRGPEPRAQDRDWLRWHAVSGVTSNVGCVSSRPHRASALACPSSAVPKKGGLMGSVIKKRRKRMAKKKHRKLLKKTRIQRRNKK